MLANAASGALPALILAPVELPATSVSTTPESVFCSVPWLFSILSSEYSFIGSVWGLGRIARHVPRGDQRPSHLRAAKVTVA